MSLLQPQTANSVESPARKAHFSTRIARPPLPPPLRRVLKGNGFLLNTNAININKSNHSYSSVNRTPRFCPVFGPKNGHFASKSANFPLKTTPFFDKNLSNLGCRLAATGQLHGSILSTRPIPILIAPEAQRLLAPRFSAGKVVNNRHSAPSGRCNHRLSLRLICSCDCPAYS